MNSVWLTRGGPRTGSAIPSDDNRLDNRRSRLVLFALLTFLGMYQADAAVVNIVSPAIGRDLHASDAQLVLVVGGYLVASATSLITWARWGALRGPHRMFLGGVAVFGVASLACGLAPNANWLIAGRIAQGIGGAAAFPQVLTAIQVDIAAGSRRARALGLYSIALAGGAVAGQVLGGILASANLFGLQWRTVFLINIPATAMVILVGVRAFPAEDRTRRPEHIDTAGILLLSTAVLSLILPITLGREAGWPRWAWIGLGASPLLLAAFVLIERRRGERRLIDLEFISRPSIGWALLSVALSISTYYALLFSLAIHLQRELGWSALSSGLALLPWVVAFGLAGSVSKRIPRQFSLALPVLGCLILAVSYSLISALTLLFGNQPAALIVLLGLGGLGLGTMFSSILVHLSDSASADQAADVSGVFTTVIQIAGALGVATFGSIYTSRIEDTSSQSALDAFPMLTTVLAVSALAAAAAASRASRRAPRWLSAAPEN